MFWLRKIVSTALLAACALAPSSAQVRIQRDYSDVLGKPMPVVVMSGPYALALIVAFGDWRKKHGSNALSDYRVTISEKPKSSLLYVRFLPRSTGGTVGCATRFGTEVLYVIDTRQWTIIRRDLPC